MPKSEPLQLLRPASSPETSLKPVVAFAIILTIARLLYLWIVCRYDLVEDEAHYWLWSRFTDWSYYSKGPGVAWVIWLATSLLGGSEAAIRTPTALLMGLGTLAVGGLARDLAARAWSSGEPVRTVSAPPAATPARVGLIAAVMFAAAPAFQMVGILMTIDGPYLACWAIAAWAFWRCVHAGSRAGWIVLGGAIAAGFLFKYTMLLLVPGLALYAVLSRKRLALAPRWRGWCAVASVLAALGLAPVVIWNAQRDWPTFRHLLGHMGLRGGDVPLSPRAGLGYVEGGAAWSPWWIFELFGLQLAMIGPALVLAVAGGVIAWRKRHEAPERWAGQAYLLACALPVLVFYACVSLITEPEGNWPLAAHVTLLPLAGWLAADALEDKFRARRRGERPPRRTRWMRTLWRAALGYALVGGMMLHFAGECAAVVNAVSDTHAFRTAFKATFGRERRPIPVGRLIGAREMAEEVRTILDSLPDPPGVGESFVIAQHYGRASQMAYYLWRQRPDAPGTGGVDVLCAGSYAGGRRSQFDLWAHADLARPELIGRSAVILSNNRPETLSLWNRLFDRVELVDRPDGRLAGEHKADRVAFIGERYRGPGGDRAPGRE